MPNFAAVQKRKGVRPSLSARKKLREAKLRYYEQNRTRIRQQTRKNLVSGFRSLIQAKVPLNSTNISQNHAALYVKARRYSGTYQRFVEEVLGLKYEAIQISKEKQGQRREQHRVKVGKNLKKEFRKLLAGDNSKLIMHVLNPAYMRDHYRNLYQAALRYSGTYQKFIEQELGLKYSEVLLSPEEAKRRISQGGKNRWANVSSDEKRISQRTLNRKRRFSLKKKYRNNLALAVSYRLQGHSTNRISRRLGKKDETIRRYLLEAKKYLEPSVIEQLDDIQFELRNSSVASAISSEKARTIAVQVRKKMQQELNQQIRAVGELGLQGLFPEKIAERMNLPFDEVKTLLGLQSESMHKRILRACFTLVKARVQAQRQSILPATT
ncbi:MAG: hypothetical protein Q7S92_04745 [Candidatus Diapherotrites archaeon]|nr:hypothetical protein [Candidatus Diapherotrites archaeon]